MKIPKSPCLLAALSLLVATYCRADIVILKNADRITGDIQSLEKQSLSLKTAYAGVIKIDWRMIQNVSTDRAFEVEIESGRRFLGPIQQNGEGLQIMTEKKPVTVAPVRVVRMEPVPEPGSETLWNRISGAIDVGYSLAKGNSDLTQSSLSLDTDYRASRHHIQLDLLSLFSRQLDAPTNSRHALNLRYDRYLSPAAFTFALSGFERDERKRLSLRSNLGGGFGWKAIRSGRTNLSILGGFTYVNEQFNNPDGTLPRKSSGEGLAELDWDKTTFGGVKLLTKLSAHPNFLESGRYRLTFDSGLRIPLVGRITWNLSLYDHFDSKPPLDVERNDYGLISSFGVTF